jgi:hypothetical protein
MRGVRDMLTMAVGHSDDVDGRLAIEAVIDQCRSSLGHRRATAGLLFSAAVRSSRP